MAKITPPKGPDFSGCTEASHAYKVAADKARAHQLDPVLLPGTRMSPPIKHAVELDNLATEGSGKSVSAAEVRQSKTLCHCWFQRQRARVRSSHVISLGRRPNTLAIFEGRLSEDPEHRPTMLRRSVLDASNATFLYTILTPSKDIMTGSTTSVYPVPGSKYRSSWSLPGSAERNSHPIAQALQPLLTSTLSSPSPRILEVASGFGHQIQAIASAHPQCRFYPTEADDYLCNEINTRAADLSNIAQAHPLDLLSHNDWLALVHTVSAETGAHQDGLFDGVIACNLIHIAPWSVTENLFALLDPRMSYVTQQGYTNLLSRKAGWIAIYGAFNEHGGFTSEGNAKFDADIRSRNPEFGLRDIQNELVPLAERHGYELCERIAMPAGNLFLIFRMRKE